MLRGYSNALSNEVKKMIESDGMNPERADEYNITPDMYATRDERVFRELDIVISKLKKAKEMMSEGQDVWYPKLEIKQATEFLQNALKIMDGER